MKVSAVVWVVVGLVVLVLASVGVNVWQFNHKSDPIILPNPEKIVFTNTIYVSKPKPISIPALNNAVLILKTNKNGTFDTNVLVVMSIDEFGKLNGQVFDCSNYYVTDITTTIEGDQLINIHYKNTNIYKIPVGLLAKIMYTPRNNVVSVGHSICGRLAFGYDRLNIVNFNKWGIGFGIWSTFNLFEPIRFWDIGVKVNASW